MAVLQLETAYVEKVKGAIIMLMAVGQKGHQIAGQAAVVTVMPEAFRAVTTVVPEAVPLKMEQQLSASLKQTQLVAKWAV